MRQVVRSRSRALRAFLGFIGGLCLLALLMAADIRWFDAAYVALAFGLLFVFSLRIVFAKWGSDDRKDVTKHGPGAAYPDSWRRWLSDDYPHHRA